MTTANLYPFITKAQLKTRLQEDSSFRKEAIVILFALQTSWEQDTASTKDKNRQGFMSSHAVNGSKVARKIIAGENLSPEDEVHVSAIAPRYTRQLALYFRKEAIAEQPGLKAIAALFSADCSAEAPEAPEAPVSDETDAS
jgi:hypothetical protein